MGLTLDPGPQLAGEAINDYVAAFLAGVERDG